MFRRKKDAEELSCGFEGFNVQSICLKIFVLCFLLLVLMVVHRKTKKHFLELKESYQKI